MLNLFAISKSSVDLTDSSSAYQCRRHLSICIVISIGHSEYCSDAEREIQECVSEGRGKLFSLTKTALSSARSLGERPMNVYLKGKASCFPWRGPLTSHTIDQVVSSPPTLMHVHCNVSHFDGNGAERRLALAMAH